MSGAAQAPAVALALDVGDARIGLAVGEVGSSFAFGRGAIERRGTQSDVLAVLEAAERERATLLVVGLPLLMDGGESHQTARVRDFAAALATRAPEGVRVEFEDERLTTKMAERQVARSALPRSKRQEKGRLDEAAAVLILESYLLRARTEGAPLSGEREGE